MDVSLRNPGLRSIILWISRKEDIYIPLPPPNGSLMMIRCFPDWLLGSCTVAQTVPQHKWKQIASKRQHVLVYFMVFASTSLHENYWIWHWRVFKPVKLQIYKRPFLSHDLCHVEVGMWQFLKLCGDLSQLFWVFSGRWFEYHVTSGVNPEMFGMCFFVCLFCV